MASLARKRQKGYSERFITWAVCFESNPHLGAIEPLMAHRAMTYRSIVVNRLSKIVYRIVEDHIEIADFWDTRREPVAQAAKVEE